jgi:hypothetical protein
MTTFLLSSPSLHTSVLRRVATYRMVQYCVLACEEWQIYSVYKKPLNIYREKNVVATLLLLVVVVLLLLFWRDNAVVAILGLAVLSSLLGIPIQYSWLKR